MHSSQFPPAIALAPPKETDLNRRRTRRYRILLATLTVALVVSTVAAIAVSRPADGRPPDSAVPLKVYFAWCSPYMLAAALLLARSERVRTIASVVALLGAAYCTFGSMILFMLGGVSLWRAPLFLAVRGEPRFRRRGDDSLACHTAGRT